MDRLLFIARFEYIRHITRRSFVIAMFGMPLFMGGMILLMGIVLALMMAFDKNEQVIGYVDYAGVIRQDVSLPRSSSEFVETVEVRHFSEEQTARDAFVAGEIDAYVVLPSDYLDSGVVRTFGERPLSFDGQFTVRWLVRKSLLADEPDTIARRAAFPVSQMKQRMVPEEVSPTPDAVEGRTSQVEEEERVRGSRMREKPWFLLVALMFGSMFVGTIFSSSSYLLQALIDEKENRTMEMVVTSVTPEQLIGGKILGLGALGLTQSLVWLSYGLGPVAGGSLFFSPLRSVFFTITGDILPLAMLSFMPFYLLYAGLIVTIGAVVGSVQEGQQLASLVSLPAITPIFLLEIVSDQPDGVVAMIASLFPLTAPLTMMLRMAMMEIPWWQFVLSLSILVLSAFLMVLVAARIFRWGMLRYGKRFRLRDVLVFLWGKQVRKGES